MEDADYMGGFPSHGCTPNHPSHGWPWLSIESHGDLGYHHGLGNLEATGDNGDIDAY